MKNFESRKKKGVVGRPSNADIAIRREILLKVYNENHIEDKTQLKAMYKNAYNAHYKSKPPRERLEFPSSDNTFKKDCRACGIDLENLEKKKSIISSKIMKVYKEIFSTVRQIRVVCGDVDVVLYDSLYRTNITKIRTDKVIEELFAKKEKQELTSSSLVHLYVILSEKGKENVIIESYFEECSYILFATSHVRCAEMVFKMGSIKPILGKTRRSIRYIVKENKK